MFELSLFAGVEVFWTGRKGPRRRAFDDIASIKMETEIDGDNPFAQCEIFFRDKTKLRVEVTSDGRRSRPPAKRPAAHPQDSKKPPPEPDSPRSGRGLKAERSFASHRDDLVRYQTQLGNGPSTTTAGEAPGCHIIQKQTGIRILGRDGPSRTQIATTDDPKETGWTNSYLPSTPPPSIAKTARTGK